MEKFIASKVFVDQKLKENYAISVEDGKIVGVGPADESSLVEKIYADCMIIPGLVDTHMHGYKGVEVIEDEEEALIQMSVNLLESGVTAFFPTLQTDSLDNMEKAIQTITKAAKNFSGAKMLGIFLEGPFLAEKFKGAQDGRYLQLPSIALLEKWQELAEGNIKKIAIAPELEGAAELIEYATQNGIIVGMGHSDATKNEAQIAVEKGATILIHSFNAMRSLHHREPGLLGVGLTDDRVFAEMICDGYHIDPLIADLIIRAKGIEKSILITDGTLASGFSEGKYNRAAVPVIVKDGAVRTKDGKLAGSSLSMIQAVRNLIQWKVASVEQAILLATHNPSRALKLSHYGEIKKGFPADFTVLDKNLNVVATYINGVKKYRGVK